MQVEDGRHQHRGGDPIAPSGPPVGEYETGDGEDGGQHEPRVHPGLGAVVVKVGTRRHQRGGGPGCPPPEELLAGPPGGGYGQQAAHHRQRMGGRSGPPEQLHPEVEHEVVERRRAVVGEVVGQRTDGVKGDPDGYGFIAPIARPQRAPTQPEGQSGHQDQEQGVEVLPGT